MTALKLEVRENEFVERFTVFADPVGLLRQEAFKHAAAGIFVFQQDVQLTKPTLLVRFTIMGQGSDTQPPKGVCLVSLNGTQLKPSLPLSIPSGDSANVIEFIYLVTPIDGSDDAIHHFDDSLANNLS